MWIPSGWEPGWLPDEILLSVGQCVEAPVGSWTLLPALLIRGETDLPKSNVGGFLQAHVHNAEWSPLVSEHWVK